MHEERPISMTARELGQLRQNHPVSRLRYAWLCLPSIIYMYGLLSNVADDRGFIPLAAGGSLASSSYRDQINEASVVLFVLYMNHTAN
jgi:hypothetical protein